MKLFVFAALLAVAVTDSRPAYQPAYKPSYAPAYKPSYAPAFKPAYQPSYAPAYKPSYAPAYKPAYQPAYKPSYAPAYKPSYAPAYKPAYQPSYAPAYKPSYAPAYKPAYQPAYKPAYQPSYKPKSYGPHEDYSEPRPYQFGYAVNDHYSGAVFSQNAQADAYGNVEGYYSVNLPDGRVQHVKYVANDYGNNAEVTYTGEAQHPQYQPKPAYHQPARSYPAPTPAYKPAY